MICARRKKEMLPPIAYCKTVATAAKAAAVHNVTILIYILLFVSDIYTCIRFQFSKLYMLL